MCQNCDVKYSLFRRFKVKPNTIVSIGQHFNSRATSEETALRTEHIAEILAHFAAVRVGVCINNVRVDGLSQRAVKSALLNLIRNGDIDVRSPCDVNGNPYRGRLAALTRQGRHLLEALNCNIQPK
jgi:hypothetical protein